MTRFITLLVAVLLLNASLAWAGHQHVESFLSGLNGGEAIANVEGSSDQGGQILEGHCDHMVSHFFAITTGRLSEPVFAANTEATFKSTPLIQISSNPPYQPPRS